MCGRRPYEAASRCVAGVVTLAGEVRVLRALARRVAWCTTATSTLNAMIMFDPTVARSPLRSTTDGTAHNNRLVRPLIKSRHRGCSWPAGRRRCWQQTESRTEKRRFRRVVLAPSIKRACYASLGRISEFAPKTVRQQRRIDKPGEYRVTVAFTRTFINAPWLNRFPVCRKVSAVKTLVLITKEQLKSARLVVRRVCIGERNILLSKHTFSLWIRKKKNRIFHSFRRFPRTQTAFEHSARNRCTSQCLSIFVSFVSQEERHFFLSVPTLFFILSHEHVRAATRVTDHL